MLQEAVLTERMRRDAADEVQYLTDLELEQIIEQSPGSDIKDYEDLQTGNAGLLQAYCSQLGQDIIMYIIVLAFEILKWLQHLS